MAIDISGDALSASTVSIGQAVSAYAILLPELRQVRRNSDDEGMRKDVQLGLISGGALTLTIGMMLSRLTQSPTPFITSSGIGVIMIGTYLYALNGKALGI